MNIHVRVYYLGVLKTFVFMFYFINNLYLNTNLSIYSRQRTMSRLRNIFSVIKLLNIFLSIHFNIFLGLYLSFEYPQKSFMFWLRSKKIYF